MPTVNKDRPPGLSGSYNRGAWRSLKNQIRLHYTQAELTAAVARGPQFLNLVVNDLESLGYAPLSSIAANGLPTAHPAPGDPSNPYGCLVLTDVSISFVGGNTVVDATLTYEHLMDGFNQILRNPNSRRLYVKARASVTEKATNFYHPNGNKSLPREVITTSHTYETLETGIPNAPYDPALPRTVVTTGEVSVPFPAENFTLQGIWFTDDIIADKNNLQGHINEDVILGKPPKTYLCSEFTYEMHNSYLKAHQQGKKGAYKVTMEFQYNYDTWEPTVVFNDQRTKGPPASVQPAIEYDINGTLNQARNPINFALQPAGWWLVPVLPTRNFNYYLGGSAVDPIIFERVGP